ncbi:MAG: rhomboid family intramembrane serine protease [Thalassovita sp.]
MDQETESPVNPVPAILVVLVVAIMAVEVAFYLGANGIVGGPSAVGWRLAAIQSYGFSDEVFDWMLTNGQWPREHLLRVISYAFLHASFVHALFACVILLALGKMVGEVVGQIALLAIFVISSVFGAVFISLVHDFQLPLIGAYPGAYGMIGAYTYLLWLRLGIMGERQVRAFSLIGMLMGIQLLFGALFGSSPDWVADVGGFAAGALVMIFALPGGLRRMRDRLRHR